MERGREGGMRFSDAWFLVSFAEQLLYKLTELNGKIKRFSASKRNEERQGTGHICSSCFFRRYG